MRKIIIFLLFFQFVFNDGDNNDRDNCNTSNGCGNGNIVNNILSGVKEVADKIANKPGTVRFIKNGKINPKYYKSGWLGGSRAKIKTFKIGKIGKIAGKGLSIINFGISAYNIGSSFSEDGVKGGIKASVKEVTSFAGSAVGSVICPVIGTIIGGYLGDLLGEIITKE